MSPLIRIVVCLWVFGYGDYALGGGLVGIALAGITALVVNHLWHEQEREQARRRHEQNAVADEQLRLDVLHRREQEGRLP